MLPESRSTWIQTRFSFHYITFPLRITTAGSFCPALINAVVIAPPRCKDDSSERFLLWLFYNERAVCTHTHTKHTVTHSLMNHSSIKKVPFAITDLTSPKRKLKRRDTSCCPRAHGYAVMEPELTRAGSVAPRPQLTTSLPQ